MTLSGSHGKVVLTISSLRIPIQHHTPSSLSSAESGAFLLQMELIASSTPLRVGSKSALSLAVGAEVA